jgi:hypothetical protein
VYLRSLLLTIRRRSCSRWPSVGLREIQCWRVPNHVAISSGSRCGGLDKHQLWSKCRQSQWTTDKKGKMTHWGCHGGWNQSKWGQERHCGRRLDNRIYEAKVLTTAGAFGILTLGQPRNDAFGVKCVGTRIWTRGPCNRIAFFVGTQTNGTSARDSARLFGRGFCCSTRWQRQKSGIHDILIQVTWSVAQLFIHTDTRLVVSFH